CVNHVLHESLAPGGNVKAVSFERDCMTASTIQVSLVSANATVANEPGNVFAVGAGVKSLYGRTAVSVAWSGPTRLTISFAQRARAGARVVHALGGCEGRAGVEAGGEEDVVVAEAVVLPGDEERAVVGGQARVPLVRGRVVVGVEAGLGVVELAVGPEARSPVV